MEIDKSRLKRSIAFFNEIFILFLYKHLSIMFTAVPVDRTWRSYKRKMCRHRNNMHITVAPTVVK